MFRKKYNVTTPEEIDDSISEISSHAGVNWIMLIYFLSGVCSLIDEVIWVRLLKLTLGNTVYASSIVVSVFMGGLALGAFIMGRYCDRIKRRLRLYALLETLVTISALAIPLVLKEADKIYIWFYRSFHPENSVLLLVQVIISAVILIVPSIFMGSTLPLLGRYVTAFEKEAGHLVGRLYSLNTLGAATGCFLTGFVLIREFGIMGSLYTGAALNLIIALGGWYLSYSPDVESSEANEDAVIHGAEVPVTKKMEGRFYVFIAAFFMSGFISIGYELLWMRSIVHILYGFTYVFSSVLTIYLLGNVIGTAIGSGLVKTLKIPAAGFAVTMFLLGLCGIFFLPFMAFWSSNYLPDINRQIELTSNIIPFSVFIAAPLVHSAFLFLIPSIIMGIGFPIALQAWTNHVHEVGKSTGTAYAANTIGAVIGGVIIGFVLIPLVGLQFSIKLLGLAGIWTAVILSLCFIKPRRSFVKLGLVTATGLTIISLILPSNEFDTIIISNPDLPKELKLVEVDEGTTTTVSVMRNIEDDSLYLFTSGARVAGDTYFWRGDQKMLGHFGVLLNKKAKKVLSIGFGSGESTACLAAHDLERADCAEIAPEMVRFSLKYFSHINLGNRLNDEINMIYMDARNYIHLTDIKYDAIINDSIHPRAFAENASLYTKEYFENAREHLNENGIFLSWIPSHNVESMEVMNSIIGTMMDVFPYVTIWFMTTDPMRYFVIAGSEQQQYFSPGYMDEVMANQKVRDSLALININNSMDIMSCYIGDKEDLMRSVRNYKVNCDYYPFIEFYTNNKWAGDSAFAEFIKQVRSDSVYRHIDWEGFSPGQKEEWISQFETLYKASHFLILTTGASDLFQKIEYCMKGLEVIPDNPALLDTLYRFEQEVLNQSMIFINGNMPQGALNVSKKLLEINPKSAISWVIKSKALEKMNDLQQAYQVACVSISLQPGIPDVHIQMGFVLLASFRYEQAAQEFRKAIELGEKDYFFVSKKRNLVLDALKEISGLSDKKSFLLEITQTSSIYDKFDRYEKIAGENKKHIDSKETKN
jgi:spermidine synthase